MFFFFHSTTAYSIEIWGSDDKTDGTTLANSGCFCSGCGAAFTTGCTGWTGNDGRCVAGGANTFCCNAVPILESGITW